MRKPFLLAVATSAALALAGCGGAAPPAAAPAPAATAPAPAGAIGDAAQLSDALTTATQGKNSATLKVELIAGEQTVDGEGAYSVEGGDIKMRLNLIVPDQNVSVELRLLDRTIYAKLPAASGAPVWVRLPVDANNPQTAEFAKLIDQIDVSKQFEQLRTAGRLTGQGPDTLDGAPTTRYDLAVDVERAAATATNDAVRGQMTTLIQGGVRTVYTQVWTDQAGLPRQIRTSYTIGNQSFLTTRKMSDWGAPVTIEAPPADQIQAIPPGG